MRRQASSFDHSADQIDVCVCGCRPRSVESTHLDLFSQDSVSMLRTRHRAGRRAVASGVAADRAAALTLLSRRSSLV